MEQRLTLTEDRVSTILASTREIDAVNPDKLQKGNPEESFVWPNSTQAGNGTRGQGQGVINTANPSTDIFGDIEEVCDNANLDRESPGFMLL